MTAGKGPRPGAEAGAKSSATAAINPAALSIEDVAKLLSAAGGRRITPEDVQEDIDTGAPVGRDGRMNLVHYTAWLIREVQAH
ncbi:MAG: hypothetical protein IT442_06675 [Phycisphaeraceae bacterium]|nr:hypothetical protein [Phycisphaeraceae bacterium]